MRRMFCFKAVLLATLVIAGPAPPLGAKEGGGATGVAAESSAAPHRSPVDLVLDPAGQWIATANQTADSVSLVGVQDGRVWDELSVGRRPEAIVLGPTADSLLVTCGYSGQLVHVAIEGEQLREAARTRVPGHPIGLAVAADGSRAFVAQSALDRVAVVDLDQQRIASAIDVGRWPRHLALASGGTRLVIGTSGDRGVTVVDTERLETETIQRFDGLNLGQLQVSADGNQVYFPWMIYRRTPIDARNIRLGWVLASRVARLTLDDNLRREVLSLDPQGEAVADPHGIALTPDESRLLVTAAGTHELLVFRVQDLPMQKYAGTDHIDSSLLADPDRFFRIPLGGRPLAVRTAPDNRTAYVANYLDNCVQVVDLKDRRVVRTIDLGGPPEPDLARRGEAIFYDGQRSLDQWYSCHSCHYEGGTNAVVMDTTNDGSTSTFKTVLPLFGLAETGPWTWHGWQDDLPAAMDKSLRETMLGPEPTAEDAAALLAYFASLQRPPNPHRGPDGSLGPAARRGEKLFFSEHAGCANCHTPPAYTDGQIHEVGTGSESDRYDGYNTPSLLGVARKVRWMHDGRCRSLAELLTGPHDPARVSGSESLSEAEVKDLIEYLKSL